MTHWSLNDTHLSFIPFKVKAKRSLKKTHSSLNDALKFIKFKGKPRRTLNDTLKFKWHT